MVLNVGPQQWWIDQYGPPQRSVRFNSADSAYLSRTPATAGNRKTWTWAGWVKRSNPGNRLILMGTAPINSRWMHVTISTDNKLYVISDSLSTGANSQETLAIFRDVSAWSHVCVAFDVTQATATDRVKFWINGVQQSTSNTYGAFSNQDYEFNAIGEHRIGSLADVNTTYYSNGYLADIHFIDGQALNPTSFGEFDANGIWQPIAYSGSYGTNGFHLPFSDNSTAAALGTDTSGNGNDWTVNNISVLQGNGNYVPAMSSSGALTYSTTFLDGFDGSITNGVYGPAGGTMTFSPSPGISYLSSVEVITTGDAYSQASLNGAAAISTPNNTWTTLATGTGTITSIVFSDTNSSEPGFAAIRVDGVILTDYRAAKANDSLVDSPTNGLQADTGVGGEVRGNYATWNPLISTINLTNGNLSVVQPSSTASSRYSTIGMSSGKWYWEISVVKYANTVFGIRTPGGGTLETPYDATGYGMGWRTIGGFFIGGSNTGTGSMSLAAGDVLGLAFDAGAGTLAFYKNGTLNNTLTASSTYIGQTWFAGSQDSVGGNSDHDVNFGQRPFAYQAPEGFKTLCTANLPAPTVEDGSDYMDVVTYTGNGTSQTISGLEFSPDLIWFKSRSASRSHGLFDSVRGRSKSLFSDLTLSELTSTSTQDLVSFDANGFTVGTVSNSGSTNTNNDSIVAWTWDAGSSTVTNTDGSITSTIRANPSAGFSIVTYTGNKTDNTTVGHGLGAVPEFIFAKNRDVSGDNWMIYHKSFNASTDIALEFNTGTGTAGNKWRRSLFSSTVFGLATGDQNNGNGEDIVAYCFAPVDGYSSFGSYTGNGSADGPFVYTGFRSRWVIIKCSTDSTSPDDWFIYDTERDTYNPASKFLSANYSGAEQVRSDPVTVTDQYVDVLANGFKIRNSRGVMNLSAETYIYAAFAENPFRSARAR